MIKAVWVYVTHWGPEKQQTEQEATSKMKAGSRNTVTKQLPNDPAKLSHHDQVMSWNGSVKAWIQSFDMKFFGCDMNCAKETQGIEDAATQDAKKEEEAIIKV
ncbi:hypothetical protein LTS17_005421 [Exophiala oligosperma]